MDPCGSYALSLSDISNARRTAQLEYIPNHFGGQKTELQAKLRMSKKRRTSTRECLIRGKLPLSGNFLFLNWLQFL
ncbi:hypothetical protein AALO_G00218080 [Alosa alosa]|uniref:Uncharacterized protein n=1 Tax=Alosa alosa TaxID=278164 RepID=A0AAV6FW86_9TELE|nr:hypothetical protein AALO_G00218080 [Alosa alosa]